MFAQSHKSCLQPLVFELWNSIFKKTKKKTWSTFVLLSFRLDLFVNLELHTQRLQKMLGVWQLLPLELHLTLQPGNKHTPNSVIKKNPSIIKIKDSYELMYHWDRGSSTLDPSVHVRLLRFVFCLKNGWQCDKTNKSVFVGAWWHEAQAVFSVNHYCFKKCVR